MLNNVALDVFIGLVFVFLLYSLLATIVQEMIATRLAFRAKVLEKAILRMLEDGKTTTRLPFGDRISGFLHLLGLKNLLKNKTVAPWFYAHPLIKYLAEDNYYSKPAYIDATNFSKVMLDLLKGLEQPQSQIVQSINNSIMAGTIHKLPISISDIANPAIKVLSAENTGSPAANLLSPGTVSINTNTALFLRSLWQDSGADINTFKLKLEDWFNDTMQRATGWYKKYTRVVLFIVGLITAYVFNVDTIAIHKILSTNKPARDQLVQMAISSKDNLNPDKILDSTHTTSDSLLSATYKMVADDALKSNDVLGLGRPWKDSCKTCRVFKDPEKLKLLTAKINSLKNETIMTTGLSDSIMKLTVLATRCPYINEQMEKTYFKYSPNQSGGWETLLGWLITALAITLGAPFWFDLLSKLISLRGSGSKINSTDDTSSENDKTSAPATPVSITVNPNPGSEAVG